MTRIRAMHRATPWKLLFMCAALAAFTAPAQAQSEGKLHGELSLLWNTLTRKAKTNDLGDSLSKTHAGLGFDIAAVIPAQDPLLVAIGLQYSRHKTDEVAAVNKLGVLEIYVEPRIKLPTLGRLSPYLFARVGYTHTTQELNLVDDDGIEGRGNAVQTGPAYGIGVGTKIRMSDHVSGLVQVGYKRHSLGDIDFDFSRIPGSALTASGVMFRAGVSLDFAPSAAIRTMFPR
jgi:opacity protein-like surface antigen